MASEPQPTVIFFIDMRELREVCAVRERL